MKIPNEFCSIDWLTILEYLKVLLSWPVAVVVIVLLLILHFKKNLATLIDRIEEADFPGGSISAPINAAQRQAVVIPSPVETPLEQAAEAAPAEEPHQANQLPPNTDIDPLISAAIGDANVVINYVLANPGPTISEYGRTFFAFNCERTFNTIFGTQIEILDRLATTGQSMTRQDISPYHQKHQKLIGNTNYTLEDYIAYLVLNQLIETDPNNQESFRATVFGLRFINYIKTNYANRWNTLPG